MHNVIFLLLLQAEELKIWITDFLQFRTCLA